MDAGRLGDPYVRGAYWAGEVVCGGSMMLEIAGEALARKGRGETGRAGGLKEVDARAGGGAAGDELVPKADLIGS